MPSWLKNIFTSKAFTYGVTALASMGLAFTISYLIVKNKVGEKAGEKAELDGKLTFTTNHLNHWKHTAKQRRLLNEHFLKYILARNPEIQNWVNTYKDLCAQRDELKKQYNAFQGIINAGFSDISTVDSGRLAVLSRYVSPEIFQGLEGEAFINSLVVYRSDARSEWYKIELQLHPYYARKNGNFYAPVDTLFRGLAEEENIELLLNLAQDGTLWLQNSLWASCGDNDDLLKQIADLQVQLANCGKPKQKNTNIPSSGSGRKTEKISKQVTQTTTTTGGNGDKDKIKEITVAKNIKNKCFVKGYGNGK